MIDITYKIFHIEGCDPTRDMLTRKMNDYLKDYFPELNTETVWISNQEEYDSFNNKYGLLNPKFEFKWGELGVWASNLLAMKNFLETDHQYLLLMEDDIRFETGFVHELFRHIKKLPDGWDVFSYYVHPNQFHRYTGSENDTGVVEAYQDWSMLCYLITRDAASKIIYNAFQGFDEPIDWHIFRHPERYKTYTITPNEYHAIELYEVKSTFQHMESKISIDKEGITGV